MIYQIISENSSSLSIASCCRLFKVSRSSYYHFLNTDAKKEETQLIDDIEKIVLKFPGYGYRRVTKALQNKGHAINHKKVFRIMRQNSLLCQLKRMFKPVANYKHEYQPYPNLIKNAALTSLNQLWASDITYIRLPKEFCYLSVVLDVYSRKVIGWSLSRNIDQELSLRALEMALNARIIKSGLIHHSDRGAQYACTTYTDLLKEKGIKISMSAKGNPYENAFAESFMATLKKEEVYLSQYFNVFEAKANIGLFIEEVYNRKRLHSSIGYLSPNDFERNITIGVS